MPLRKRRAPEHSRVLTASALHVELADRKQAEKIRRLRQGWQEDAWSYRDSIPEISYAMRFKSTAVSRMRLFPALWVEGEDQPVPLDELKGNNAVPAAVIEAAKDALDALGPGRMGHANLLKNLSENSEVAGECYLLGDENADTGEQEFSIRSIDELVVSEQGQWMLRALPGTGTSNAGAIPVGKDAYIARMWTPHPRFTLLADSPMRALLEACEELMVLSRMIRAQARSRYATAGIMGVANEFSFPATTNGADDDDPEADPFMAQLTEAMVTAITDEASAAAVVPIVIRGPADRLKDGLIYIDPSRGFDDKASPLRQELLGRIANGLDIPREILTGMADLNHWTAWQVDDSTFRYHIEPGVLKAVDSLTVGYYRPRLKADIPTIDPDVLNRLVIWYDPTDLVTHPDRTQDALSLHGVFAISDEALRDAAGFDEGDKPDDEELLTRQLTHLRTMPPNLVEAIVHNLFPQLEIPPDKNEPGLGPQDQDVAPPDDATPAIQAPGTAPPKGVAGPPSSQQPGKGGPPAVAAAAPPLAIEPPRTLLIRESDKLARIDASLRDRIHTAAEAAMTRALERAGNRVRGKAPNGTKASLSNIPPEYICAHLGRDAVLAYGLTEQTLIADAFASLGHQVASWIDAAQRAALTAAVAMTGASIDDPMVAAARVKQEGAARRAVTWLTSALSARAAELLYHPIESQTATTGEPPVPFGIVRGATALAGGYDQAGAGMTTEAMPVDPAKPLSGIGSGPIVTDVLTSRGARVDHYIWVHGIAQNPFEPHLALDGHTFTQFTDSALANGSHETAWVGNAYYFPGDHKGCSCDVQLMWSGPASQGDQVDYGLAASTTPDESIPRLYAD